MGRGGARDEETQPRLRLDKWIWFARFQRSRERCAELVRKGHVRVNGRRETAPGAFIKVGDVLTLALSGGTMVVRVVDLAERRSDAEAAQTLFLRLDAEN